MNPSPLESLAAQLAARTDAIRAEFAPKVRNHLVQLFRKAHAVQPTLTGVRLVMGGPAIDGTYTVTADGETWEKRAFDWSPKSYGKGLPEVEAFLAEVAAYGKRYCQGHANDLPAIADITLDDLTPERVKRARVWRRA